MKFNPNDPKHWKDFDPFAKAEEFVDGKSETNIKRAKNNVLYKAGKKDSPELRKKKSVGQTGRIKPEFAKKMTGRKRPEFANMMKGKQIGELNGNSKTYIVTEPCGKTYEVIGLKNFSEKLNKPVVTAREMAMGKYPGNTSKRGAWSGWKIIEK